jgi:cytochrome c-type biogenesis protein CcmH
MDKTLSLDPANPTVLGMQGIDAFENGRYREAIEAWQRLLAVLPSNSERAVLIQSGIGEAKNRLGEIPQAQSRLAASDDSEQEQVVTGIWVSVDIAENIRQQVNPNTAVFIYARAAEGPKAPLAVKRLRLADLPVRVLLDDAASMAPQFKLSAFAEVVVGARLSLSGEPIAQQGDWFAQTLAIVWRENNQQSLLIEQQVK